MAVGGSYNGNRDNNYDNDVLCDSLPLPLPNSGDRVRVFHHNDSNSCMNHQVAPPQPRGLKKMPELEWKPTCLYIRSPVSTAGFHR